MRLAKDLNGRLKVIGDGINAAKSIMKFAEPGQILVSLSLPAHGAAIQSHADLFHYEGAKTDEDSREYPVYVVSAAPSSLSRNQAAEIAVVPNQGAKTTMLADRPGRQPQSYLDAKTPSVAVAII